MCGIAGILDYARRAPVAPATMAAMRAAMAHRGPDAQGELFRPRWGLGLGHVRLSIIDLAGGDQPLSNEDGTVWTVFNGEIYNFRELRARLEAAGHVFRTRSDTEVLVHLYEEKGERLVDDLLGDFAFAIWDDRDGSLLLARDHLGVKPLYYCDYDGQFAFASTLPALLEGTAAPREVEPLALLSYLTFYVVQAPLTIYRAARKLPPGHVLTVRGGEVRLRAYWDLRMEPEDERSLDSFAEELEALVLDAVRRQMVADVPLGAFLSGGIDSSLVVRAMTECSAGPVKTFSIGYREPAYDESRFYRLLARELNVEHHELVFEPRLLEDVTHIVEMFGEPCAIGSAFPLYYLAKLARQHVTVALSGDGPDEIFAGYDLRYRYLQRMHRARRVLPRLALVGAGAALSTTHMLRTTGRIGNLLRQLRKFCETAALPPEQWQPHLAMNRTLRTSPAALMAEPVDPGRLLPYVRAFIAAGRPRRLAPSVPLRRYARRPARRDVHEAGLHDDGQRPRRAGPAVRLPHRRAGRADAQRVQVRRAHRQGRPPARRRPPSAGPDSPAFQGRIPGAPQRVVPQGAVPARVRRSAGLVFPLVRAVQHP